MLEACPSVPEGHSATPPVCLPTGPAGLRKPPRSCTWVPAGHTQAVTAWVHPAPPPSGWTQGSPAGLGLNGPHRECQKREGTTPRCLGARRGPEGTGGGHGEGVEGGLEGTRRGHQEGLEGQVTVEGRRQGVGMKRDREGTKEAAGGPGGGRWEG